MYFNQVCSGHETRSGLSTRENATITDYFPLQGDERRKKLLFQKSRYQPIPDKLGQHDYRQTSTYLFDERSRCVDQDAFKQSSLLEFFGIHCLLCHGFLGCRNSCRSISVLYQASTDCSVYPNHLISPPCAQLACTARVRPHNLGQAAFVAPPPPHRRY